MDSNDGQPPSEPTLPSLEQMRARRLAKLGGNTGSNSNNNNNAKDGGDGGSSSSTGNDNDHKAGSSAGAASTSSPADSASTTPTPAGRSGPSINITPRPASTPGATASTSTPVLRLGNKSSSAAPAAPAVTATTPSSPSKRPLADFDPAAATSANAPTDAPARRPAASPAAGTHTPARPPVSPEEALAEWVDHTISHVLRITVEPTQTRDRHGHALTFLPNLREEMLERTAADGPKAGEAAPNEAAEKATGETTDEATGEAAGKSTGETTDEATGEAAGKSTGETTDEATGEAAGKSTGETAGSEAAGDAAGEAASKKAEGSKKPRLRLTADDIEPAILEACTAYPPQNPLLDYLLPCYKAASRLLKGRITVPQRSALLHELKRLCTSNIIFALTMPELFGREPNPEHDTLAPYLLRGVSADDPLCLDMDFISDAVSRFDDDEDGQVEGIFTRAMVEISAKLSKISMNDDYQPYIEAMLLYTRYKPLLVALAKHPTFQMAQSAPNIERFTILGPFFRISPLQTDVCLAYFTGLHKVELQRKESVYSALQMAVSTHQSSLHTIAMAFARAGDEPRNKLLDWFAYVMNVNHKRRAMQVHAKDVSSDGFMLNVGAVLDRMCEPFMDANFSRMDRIEVEYLRRKPRIDIRDETKLNADQAQSDAFYAKTVPGDSNFISELFFLNTASHHYGNGAAQQKYKDMDREIKHMEGQLAQLEEERKKLAAGGAGGAPVNPRAMALVEQHLKTYMAAIDRHVAYKHALEAVLLDEKVQQRSLMFMRYVSVWLLRVATGSDYRPDKELQLPLPREEPEAFSCLPEFALQNVVDHFKFLFQRVPRILPSAVGDEMVALCVTFLESSEYIRNPYLKSSLVSLLFSGTWRMYHLANGVLGDSLTNSKFANKYLLHSLLKFYIECESTGTHTQFYDKFNIRYEIFQVIKTVWPNDLYKQQLTNTSRTNRSFFVRFVNMLLNDATYVLDEALSRFPKIHDLQRELQNAGGMQPEERQQKEAELQQAEGQAQSYMQLANETVGMMKLFTEALSDAFTMPEIVSRLAGMLDYNLVTLAGPASRNLKVENPEKYHFNPKVLLPLIVELYLNLGDKASFVEAVANDGRSYKPEIFDHATRILTTKGLMDPAKLHAWVALKDRFAQAKEMVDQAELDLGEIPDNFEDPIMGDLMRDPVILPSRHIVDRSTIAQHLLSDAKDPFTRQPMTEDDVVPATELKQEIEAWKAERIAASKAKAGAAIAAMAAPTSAPPAAAAPPGFEDEEADAMDTTE